MIPDPGPKPKTRIQHKRSRIKNSMPASACDMFRIMLSMLDELDLSIAQLDNEIACRAREDAVVRRLMTIPGIGPIAATAIAALAPAAETFRCGRDFAAGLGLTPRQMSTGGKTKLGRISKMGERTIIWLLIIGANTFVQHADRRDAPEGSWLANMLAGEPRMLMSMAQAHNHFNQERHFVDRQTYKTRRSTGLAEW